MTTNNRKRPAKSSRREDKEPPTHIKKQKRKDPEPVREEVLNTDDEDEQDEHCDDDDDGALMDVAHDQDNASFASEGDRLIAEVQKLILIRQKKKKQEQAQKERERKLAKVLKLQARSEAFGVQLSGSIMHVEERVRELHQQSSVLLDVNSKITGLLKELSAGGTGHKKQ